MHEPLPISALPDVVAPDVVPHRRHVLHRDYETRSPVLLKKVGAHRYAADPRTSIICAAYAVDDGPAHLWLPGNAVPRDPWSSVRSDGRAAVSVSASARRSSGRTS